MISFENRNPATTNLLKTMYFQNPGWTPCRVGLMPATWMRHREGLEEIVLEHPRLFPGYRKGSVDFDFPNLGNPLYELGKHTDCWGTVWDNLERGLDSYVVEHPLEDWTRLKEYTPPDPMKDDVFGPRDWDRAKQWMDEARARGDLPSGGLPHGFMYMRLYYIRGFENLMMDIATGAPHLRDLIAMVEEYNVAVVRRFVDLGAEYMLFGDDLGLQKSLPMSPRAWREVIKPSYDRILKPCRDAGIPVYLHTDGHILEIIPDLIEVGVTILNPQYRANGLEGLKAVAKGRVCIDQDLDRQFFPFGTAREIRDHIRGAYEALHDPRGGLLLFAECEPDVPLDNIRVICEAMEEILGEAA